MRRRRRDGDDAVVRGAVVRSLAVRIGAVRADAMVRCRCAAVGQEPGPSAGRVIADIRDRAGLFGADAIATARRELERIARQSGASIVIETVDSLEGEPADKAAVNLARRSGIRGIFILAARKEHKLEVLGSGHYRES